MKKLIPIILVIVLTAVIFMPGQGAANSELREIERQIEQLRQEKVNAEKRAAEAERRIQVIQVERNETRKSIEELNAQIAQAEAELAELNAEIETTEANLVETEQQLTEAIQRIEDRDQLLRSRLRLIYTNGTVSYLEILMSATSFSDFLDRYNNLKSLVNSDKAILERNIEDRLLVEEKKVEIEEQIVHLSELYVQQEQTIEDLLVREKEAEVVIASLNHEEEHLGEITEEQEKFLMNFAAAEAALLRKKYAIEANFDVSTLSNPLPQKYRVSSNFGPRTHPVTGAKGKMHNGTDFAAPNGTDILAAANGRVVTAGWMSGYGNTVIIDHGNDKNGNEVWTLYAHIRPNGIKVKVGDSVKRRDKIAEVGTTGASTGYHLHFEVRINQKAVNPLDYLNF